jgi:predicted CoA-substrate-specific enzyme activase
MFDRARKGLIISNVTEKSSTETLNLGLDVGSTTVKTAVLDDDGKVLWNAYERHYSKIKETVLGELKQVDKAFPGASFRLSVTGSAGLGFAERAGLPFVQEVEAAFLAVNAYHPKTDVVIELGGEDAKIIFLTGGVEERMNGSCAGGTGAFIDQMASLLNVSIDELDELSLKAVRHYPIASRCGVFAKSDIQPLINQGARKEDIAASIYHSVVEQTIAGLAQGRKIEGYVMFLGGPLSFLKGLRKAFVETLNLDEEHAIFPPLAKVYMAIGSALFAEKSGKANSLSFYTRKLSSADLSANFLTAKPLFENEAEYEAFKKRHKDVDLKKRDLSTYKGKSYLGIDAGSTTTKYVLLSESHEILRSYYSLNSGSPIEAIKAALLDLYSSMPETCEIASSAVIGYGEDLIKSAFDVDYGLVETVAHLKAAKYFEKDVDFVIDIGGQDIKCFKIKNGAIDSLVLNEACSSGCGSFIQNFAESLGYDVASFAKIALYAKHPVELGSRCTVFMNSSVKQAQKEGATVGDIAAGLASSVVKNAIYKVIRFRTPDELGKKIVCQGGTFLNDAILRSFEREVGREVIRPSIAGLMGAFGAALYAEEKGPKGGLISYEGLKELRYESRSFQCQGCLAHCSLTLVSFPGGKRFIAGNKCDKGAGKKEENLELNGPLYQYSRLFKERPRPKDSKGTVGIPRSLLMYEQYPFWDAYFKSLGFDTILSDESSRDLYFKGRDSIPSDTVCYPAKIMHGHIASLLEKKPTFIFYPSESYNFDEGGSDNHFNCPVVAYYSESLLGNFPGLSRDILYNPYFDVSKERTVTDAMKPYLKRFGVGAKDLSEAYEEGMKAYSEYKADILQKTKDIIDEAHKEGKPIIVLAGRPYHLDPEINHSLPRLISSLGFAVIPASAAAEMDEGELRPLVLNQWTYHSRLYHAAHFVTGEKDMELVQLVSFGCGIDAITTDEVRSILERGGKLYTQLKIDEISNLGAARIRLRSLKAAMEERKDER